MSIQTELPSKNKELKYGLNSLIKKTIILISALLLTGCGKIDGSGKGADNTGNTQITAETSSDKSDITSQTAEVSSENTQAAGTTDDKDDSDIIRSGNYEDAIRLYYNNMNNGEYKKILMSMYPEDLVESMFSSGQITEEQMAEQIGFDDHKYKVNKVAEETSISDEEKEFLLSSYDQMITMLDIKSEYGDDINSLSEDQQKEIQQKYNDVDFDNMKHHYNITEGYDVTVSYSTEEKDGEESMYVFYVDGEGWKIQHSMRKFASGVLQNQVNMYAKEIFTDCQCQLVELETQGVNADGIYIISSDDSKGIDVPAAVDSGKIRDMIRENIPEDVSYFVVISNYECQYAAAFNDQNDKDLFASYPAQCIPESISDSKLKTSQTDKNDYSFDELYKIAVDAIK